MQPYSGSSFESTGTNLAYGLPRFVIITKLRLRAWMSLISSRHLALNSAAPISGMADFIWSSLMTSVSISVSIRYVLPQIAVAHLEPGLVVIAEIGTLVVFSI